MKLDLENFTPRQYAALILRDELKLTHGKAGIKMGITRDAFNTLYRRAKLKEKMNNTYDKL